MVKIQPDRVNTGKSIITNQEKDWLWTKLVQERNKEQDCGTLEHKITESTTITTLQKAAGKQRAQIGKLETRNS